MGKTKIKTIGEEVETSVKPKSRDDGKESSRREAATIRPLAESEDARQETGPAGPRATKEKKEKISKISQKKTLRQVQGEPKKRGKKYREMATKVDPQQKYQLKDAVKLAQETSYSKFPSTLEAHLNTSVKNIRGLVSLPYMAGKKLTILAFPSASSGQVATDLGDGVIIGNDETITEIEKGPSAGSRLKFDVLVTTPAWMPKLARVAKILGPRGLMPSPKNGTITENLVKTVAELQGGKIEYKTEKDGRVIHLSVGKIDQQSDEIAANIKVLYNTIGKSKITKVTLSPTMGPGVKVELSSI